MLWLDQSSCCVEDGFKRNKMGDGSVAVWGEGCQSLSYGFGHREKETHWRRVEEVFLAALVNG